MLPHAVKIQLMCRASVSSWLQKNLSQHAEPFSGFESRATQSMPCQCSDYTAYCSISSNLQPTDGSPGLVHFQNPPPEISQAIFVHVLLDTWQQGSLMQPKTTAEKGAAHDTVRPYATPAMYRFLAHLSLTCVDGNADVRSVSCVSSTGRLRGTLSTNAAWSGVAAQAVIR